MCSQFVGISSDVFDYVSDADLELICDWGHPWVAFHPNDAPMGAQV